MGITRIFFFGAGGLIVEDKIKQIKSPAISNTRVSFAA
jgi:hypothetical protein